MLHRFKIIFTTGILVLTSVIYAQTPIDSLEALLSKAKKENRIPIMNSLAKEYFYARRLEDCVAKAQEAYDLALKTKNINEQARALNTLGMAYSIVNDIKKSYEYAIKALKLAQEAKNKEEQGHAWNLIGDKYEQETQYQKALECYLKSLSIRREINDKTGESKSLNQIGQIYFYWSRYNDAINYFNQSLALKLELGDKRGAGITYTKLANVFAAMDKNEKAIENAQKARKVFEEIDFKAGISNVLNLTGVIYENMNTYNKAIETYKEAYQIEEQLQNKEGMANVLSNIGNVYSMLGKLDKALDYYNQSLKIREQIGDKAGIAKSLQNIGLIHSSRKNHALALTYYQRANAINKELDNKLELSANLHAIGRAYIELGQYENALSYLNQSHAIAKELNLLKQLKSNYLSYSDLYKKQKEFEKALSYYEQYSKINDSLNSMEQFKAINELMTKYETEKKEKEIQLLNKDKLLQSSKLKEQEATLKRQRLQRNAFILGFLLVLMMVFVVFRSLQQKKRDNAIIEAEKQKSDALLLNTLPLKVVDDLKTTGKTEPEVFENVSVYFSDVKGFTDLSSNLEPKYLIDKLNEMFTAFDDIMTKYQCERIKTIGDAYMAVCGMPVKNENHADLLLKAAMEILDYLEERNKKDDLPIYIRIGINSGKVTGGIVGVRKYIYDVFGDTVNTASRMESNGEPMKINVSEATYSILKDKYRFIDRGISEIKGKGKLRMYFLDYNPGSGQIPVIQS